MQSQSFSQQSKPKTVASQAEGQLPLPSSANVKTTSKKRMLDQITGGRKTPEASKPMKANKISGQVVGGKLVHKQQPSSMVLSKAKRAPFGDIEVL